MTLWEKAGYGALMVAQAICVQVAIMIGAGQIPAPFGQAWLLPLIGAGVSALAILLPSVREGGHDHQHQRSDRSSGQSTDDA